MSRIVWFHPRFPWPVRHGGDLRTTGLVDCALRRGHEVLLVTPEGDPALVPAGLQHHGAGGRAMPGLAAAKVVSRHPLRSPRPTRGDVRAIDAAVRSFEPQVAFVSEVMAWSLAAPVCAGRMPWVYDSPNVESSLFAELASGAGSRVDRFTLGVDARRVRREEQRMLDRAAHVVAASEGDASVLRVRARGGVTVVPSSVPTPASPTDPATAGPVVMFVGTLDYGPNREAVLELVHEVMPRVRASVDDARLVVVGRRPEQVLRSAIGAHDWADLRVDVADLAEQYAQARVVVLPIRTGSGTNLKTVEALAHGLPVVATPTAMRGMGGAPALVATSPADLAELAARLLVEAETAGSLGAAGRDYFLRKLSWDGAAVGLDDVITSLEPQARG